MEAIRTMKNPETEELTPFHEEPYGKVRSWKAYGNGILAWREGELYAYTIDGRKSLLVASAREDAQAIGRDWSYHPYSRGAIFYEWSRRMGHEGMEIDKRVEITAYPDLGTEVGKKVTLYDSKDQYILPPLEWAACSSGIIVAEKVVAEKDESWNAIDKDNRPDKTEKNKEKTFILYSVDSNKKQLYRGWGDEWKPYGWGIIIRQGNEYFSCNAENRDNSPKKLVECNDVEYWTGYGQGLILSKKDELWAFRDGYNGHHSQQIFQGEWKRKAQPHLPARPCFRPCLEGMVMEQGVEPRPGKQEKERVERKLVLYRDHAAQEILYAGDWKSWEVYDNLLVVEQLQSRGKETVQRWSAFQIKDSTSVALAGIEKALQHREISRTGTER